MFRSSRLRRALLPAVLGASAFALAPAPALAATQPFQETLIVRCTNAGYNLTPLEVTIRGQVPGSTAPGEAVAVTDLSASIVVGTWFASVGDPRAKDVLESRLEDLTLTATGASAPLTVPGLPLSLPPATERTGTDSRRYPVEVPRIAGTTSAVTASSAPVVLRLGSLRFANSTHAAGAPAGPLDRTETCTPEANQRPLAIVKSTGELPGAPVIESISPNRGPMDGGDTVVIKGRNLAYAESVLLERVTPYRSFRVVDDRTIEFTVPGWLGDRTEPVTVATPFGVSAEDPAARYTWMSPDRTAPTAPLDLKVSGGGTGALLNWRASTDDVGVVAYEIFRDGSRVATVDGSTTTYAAAGLEPGTTQTFGVRARDGDGHVSNIGPVAVYRVPAPCSGCGAYAYAIAGSTTLRTLTKGTVPFKGRLAVGALDAATGQLTAGLDLEPARARLTVLGFIPVTASIALVTSGQPTGVLIPGGGLTLKALARLKMPEVKLFGTIALAGGTTCQARSLSTIELRSSDFTLARGGTLSSTFAISDLSGCGALNGLVSPLTAGGGNTIRLALS